MSWIEKVRQKPQEQKIRLIWTVVILAAIALIILWIVLGRYSRSLPRDTSIFQTIGKGFKDVKENYNK
jgi:hypothetical protein